MIGETISHYRIIKKLGEGGMGVVYVAEDILLGRRVAIKTLNSERGQGDQHFRARFLREARAVSTLSHQHIANIYDYGETDDGQPYIVMELVEGKTLVELMRAEKLTIPRTIEIVNQVAEALSEAHLHGIVHRDIKPSNIALTERGMVKVLDFGLAKHVIASSANSAESAGSTAQHTQTREGVIVGTPMYLSPEQALALDIDGRSDLFSLGSVLYECIAGRPAFAGKSDIDICAKVIRDDPPPPSEFNGNVPQDLDRITLKALAKQPEARYQTASEMIADLSAAQTDIQKRGSDQTVTRLLSPVSSTQPSSALATLSDIFRRPRLSIGYVVAAAIVVIAIIFGISRFTRATLPKPSPEAQQLYEKGVAALQEGSYFKASKLLERAVAVDDKFAFAHARLAEAYTELDYADRAKDQILSASRIVTDRSMLDRTSGLYYDAIQATVARDLSGAINDYSEISKANLNSASAYLDLGRAYENHDEVDKAIEQYTKVTSLNQTNPAPFLRLAVLYGRHQDLANSNTAFDKADGLYKDDQNIEGNAEVAYQRGYLFSQMSKIPEAHDAAQHSLEVARLAGNQYQQVRALLLLSAISYSSGDTAKAQPLATEAIELARANDMENLATQGLLDLGNASLLRRGFDDAERYARQGLDLAQRYKEKRNEARANLLLGSTYIQQELADKGAPFIDRALTFYRDAGYRRELSRCMIMNGRVQLLRGDFDGALKTLDEQLQLAKQVEDPGELSRSQQEVASALSKQDFYPQALERYTESYELSKKIGNPMRAAFALLNRGDMLARLGRFEEAEDALNALLLLTSQLSADNDYRHLWDTFSHLIRAQMRISTAQYEAAKKECQVAQAIIDHQPMTNLGNSQAEVEGALGLAQVYLGQVTEGKRLIEAAVHKAISTAEPSSGDPDLDLVLAESMIVAGDPLRAREAALRAQQTATSYKHPESEWRAHLFAALSAQSIGDAEAARAEALRARSILELLHVRWGDSSYNTYTKRQDIDRYRRQIDGLVVR